ncbi:MAG: hypothetical protein KDD45_06320 [Bdellovibrionales bacterium]|nr:hypothetical protein [Bdellovibrionales bacterium]
MKRGKEKLYPLKRKEGNMETKRLTIHLLAQMSKLIQSTPTMDSKEEEIVEFITIVQKEEFLEEDDHTRFIINDLYISVLSRCKVYC